MLQACTCPMCHERETHAYREYSVKICLLLERLHYNYNFDPLALTYCTPHDESPKSGDASSVPRPKCMKRSALYSKPRAPAPATVSRPAPAVSTGECANPIPASSVTPRCRLATFIVFCLVLSVELKCLQCLWCDSHWLVR